jgi:hypothetical protein
MQETKEIMIKIETKVTTIDTMIIRVINKTEEMITKILSKNNNM